MSSPRARSLPINLTLTPLSSQVESSQKVKPEMKKCPNTTRSVHRKLREGKFRKRIGANAPVYLAAVLEYLAAEMLEIAGNAAQECSVKRVTPRHVLLGIRADEDVADVLLGVRAYIHAVLPKSTALLPTEIATTQ